MFILAVLVTWFATALSCHPIRNTEIDAEWNAYKLEFNKTYNSYSNQDEVRKTIFFVQLLKIALVNYQYQTGEISYTIGLNEFSDYDLYDSSRRGLKVPADHIRTGSKFLSNVTGYPDSIDWRTLGAVTPVKNQFSCGSSWAFSATGALEGQHFRKTGKLVSLSEQQLLDCVSEDYGCDGGLPEDAFKYIKENSGLDTEASYPYVAKRETCNFITLSNGATDVGYVDIENSELEILQAVGTVGPVSVGIFSAVISFMEYKKGIYDSPECVGSPDHAVLIVGYGSENGLNYWIIKNSWGPKWGEDGYMRMVRGKNMCNISLATYPLV